MIVPIPDWITAADASLPTEGEMRPWFHAVCALWDDPDLYRRIGERAREIAASRYGEAVSRNRHVAYLASLEPGHRPFES